MAKEAEQFDWTLAEMEIGFDTQDMTALLLLRRPWQNEKEMWRCVKMTKTEFFDCLIHLSELGFAEPMMMRSAHLPCQIGKTGRTAEKTRWRLTPMGMRAKKSLKEAGWYLADAE